MRKKDWAVDQARRIVDTILTSGLSHQVAVNYMASELRVTHQRGGIEATPGTQPVKPPKKVVEKQAATTGEKSLV